MLGSPTALPPLEEVMYRLALQPGRPGLPGRDPMTGLPNRALLLEALNPMLALARRNDRGLAVLHVRLVGRDPGTAVGGIPPLLRESAETIRGMIRDCDLVGRISGDTFIVALAEVGHPDGAVRMARRLHGSLQTLHGMGGNIGIALFPIDGGDAAALISAAERATPSSEPIGLSDGVLSTRGSSVRGS